MSKRKTKKGTTAWHRQKAVEIAKKLAKIRDKNICQKCGKLCKGANAHGSHVYSEGAYPNISAEVDNIKCLCYRCHFQWWHKEPMDAKDWFAKKFPRRAKKLLKIKNELIKRDWEQVHLDLKEELRRLEGF